MSRKSNGKFSKYLSEMLNMSNMYLSRHIRLRGSAPHLRSSAVPLLYKPTTRTRFADGAFRCTAPTV